MSYTLRSGVTAGHVDGRDGDRLRIADHELTVDDYDHARWLCARYAHLQWPDGDPGPGEDDGGADEADADDADDDHFSVHTVSDLEALSYRELQDLAQEHDIKANQSTEDLIAELREA